MQLRRSIGHFLQTRALPEIIAIVFGALLLLIPLLVSNNIIHNWNQATYALYFTSAKFLFLFLPGALFAFFITERLLGERFLVPLMFCISLAFYASWGIKFLPVLIGSITFNFTMRQLLRSDHLFWVKRKRLLLIITICVNLAALAFFKYADFLIANVNHLLGLHIQPLKLFLPLGISFFTFQEITLAVDTYRGAYSGSFLKYILFVSFFPHLVAGPLVHHREMMPQFSRLHLKGYNLIIGLGLITIGLFKKMVIADSLSPFVKAVFDSDPGHPVVLIAAWTAAVAYAFQIYFDFSGYSDMALGLARLFGVRLPINFNAPYKAHDIIDFWRRWHVTLSRFLREYIYFPLGGNRLGPVRRYVNLMIVMLLCGLWHGPNWTFVIWGGLHGLFLVLNHGWRFLCRTWPRLAQPLPTLPAQLVTFVGVVVAWVPFRASSFDRTRELWSGMEGVNGVGWQVPPLSFDNVITALDRLQVPAGTEPLLLIASLLILYIFCLAMPASHQVMRLRQAVPGQNHPEPSPHLFLWRASAGWAIFMGMLFGASMLARHHIASEFLYWNF